MVWKDPEVVELTVPSAMTTFIFVSAHPITTGGAAVADVGRPPINMIRLTKMNPQTRLVIVENMGSPLGSGWPRRTMSENTRP
jgi:hypothetical protein